MSEHQGKERMIDRRTFLKYSGMLGIGVAAGCVMPLSECVAFDRKLYKVTRTRPAMGTFVAVTVMHPSQAEADDVIEKVFDEMKRVSALMDRYNSSSAIGTLNRDGYLADIPGEVAEVVGRSLQFHQASGGAFDITVKPVVDFYKEYFAAHGNAPVQSEVESMLTLVDGSAVQFDGRSIRLTKEGM
jgi:thiamine biosynthesis lipoprotein